MDWVIAIDGSDLESLGLLEFFDRATHIDSVEAFDSLDIQFSAPSGVDTVSPSKVMIGSDVQLVVGEEERFTGKIKGWSPDFDGRTVTVHCFDYSLTMRGEEKTRSFNNMTLGQIITSIAGKYPKIKNLDVDDPDFQPRGQIAQSNQCDRSFLLDLSNYCDRIFWIGGDTLHFRSLDSLEFDSRILVLHPEADQTDEALYEELAGFRPAINIIDVDSTIEVISEDTSLKDNIKGVSTQDLIYDGDLPGRDFVISICGDRKRIILDRAPKDEREAVKIAKAHFSKRADNFVSGEGHLVFGNPKLIAGSRRQVLLNGFPGFDSVLSGMYKIKEVTGVIEGNILETSFSFGRNAINEEQ